MPDARPAPIPVTLIGGFLGAGKTTLLNHILSDDHGVRAAVLVNDFGSINIDARLVVGVEGDTLELANGCVCCTIRDDLAGACLALLQRPERPEHLFIELSGVSDPVPVINTFLETELRACFALSSVLAVVDAEQFPLMNDHMAHLARSQLGAADIIVLNKADLVSKKQLDYVRTLVHGLTPGARIIDLEHGRLPLALVFTPPGEVNTARQRDQSGHKGEHSHAHDFATWSWSSDRPLSLPGLRSVLEALPDSVYRCKGIVYFEEMPRNRYVLQMVGKRYHIEEVEPQAEQRLCSEIVLIGGRQGINDRLLKPAFDSCIGTGDESHSPTLRLMRKLAPELLEQPMETRR